MPSSPPAVSRSVLRPLAAAFALALACDASSAVARPAEPRTLVVGNCDDSGAGSLRDAVSRADDGDTIDLTQLTCSTITLSTGAILIGTHGLTLHGPGNHALAISAAGGSHESLIEDLGGGLLTIDGIDLQFGAKYSDKDAAGGCVYTAGDLAVHDSRVSFCGVHAGDHVASGGALYAMGSVTLTNVDVEFCGVTTSGTARGGGVFSGGDMILIDSRVSGCRNATPSNGVGGGIYVGGDLDMKYSTLDNNANDDAIYGDGGGAFVRGRATIYWSTISNNRATVGGGIDLSGDGSGTAVIADSTISNNYAHAGGGIATFMPLSLENSTVAFNRIAEPTSTPFEYAFSAGIAVRAAAATLASTIVANNVIGDDPGEAADIGGDLPNTIGGMLNLVMSSAFAMPADTIADDPRLAPLAGNGGPTQTHALLPGSPALDHGAADDLETDQRGPGFPRVQNGIADIGAYEADPDLVFANGFD